MKVRGLEEGCRGEKRWGGKRWSREAKEWQTGKRKSMLSLINSNSPRLHGGLSLKSFFFLFHSNMSFPPPLSMLFSSHLLFFSFVQSSFSLFSFSLWESALCFQLRSLNPVIFFPSKPFDFSHPDALLRANIANSACVLQAYVQKNIVQ